MNTKNQELKVNILEYSNEYASDFARLNYEWLNQYFEIEPHDKEMLDNPDEYILSKGGQIFFAQVNGEIVGTAALIVETSDSYELAKMGVSTKYRGLKVGKKIINHAIDFSRSKGKKSIVLESNTKLTPAINLYIQSGFKAVPMTGCSPYSRCNIRMELAL
ncbi:MAG: GNAT family N-acetyltransferase [Flammeovirgaceae bacterium]|nr:GNAT family N-acetyltransferase [Flammeovirgaceae bacterium]MBR09009.1 GNAT family N-acetyltransferase [Rickettsiales bacterium]HCX23350.1 GNAT family N-acetyltransferase [Cytophagales bacterium]|tara:strand:- start:2791 stop:3273 length:483 start_codon:yes stop_codon:yes gene_type:complete